jgi:hypothetical protein
MITFLFQRNWSLLRSLYLLSFSFLPTYRSANFSEALKFVSFPGKEFLSNGNGGSFAGGNAQELEADYQSNPVGGVQSHSTIRLHIVVLN